MKGTIKIVTVTGLNHRRLGLRGSVLCDTGHGYGVQVFQFNSFYFFFVPYEGQKNQKPLPESRFQNDKLTMSC